MRCSVTGDTKSSVWLQGGFTRSAARPGRRSRGAAMQYFTGSKRTTSSSAIARAAGLKLNEYGLFTLEDDTGELLATRKRDLRALDCAGVEPELREHRGEIEAALDGALPHLGDDRRFCAAISMHTTDHRRPRLTWKASGRRQAQRHGH
jgi:DNA polymerase (family 10)